MSHELLNHHILGLLLTDGNSFRIGDDYLLEVVDILTIYMVALLDLAYWDLGYCMVTEY